MRSSILAAVAATALAGFAVAADNSASSDNTVQLFIDDALNGKGRYAASVVNACKDQTVYAIQCTSDTGGYVGSRTCGAAAPVRNLGTHDKRTNQKLTTYYRPSPSRKALQCTSSTT